MWDTWESDGSSIYLVTTNAYITKDKRLVMGRGAAKDLRDGYKNIDKLAAQLICDSAIYHKGYYGVILLPYNTGIFQVKHHYMDKADLDLIDKSTKMLNQYASIMSNITFHLNYPGIGNGKLEEEKVYPIIKDLPDNVHIWKLGEKQE